MNGGWYLFTARTADRACGVVWDCAKTGAQLPIVVDDVDRQGIGMLMDNEFYRDPDRDFYGWLADDTHPQTDGWSDELAAAAGRFGLAYANDGGYLSPGGGPANGEELSSGLCWGGDLIRAVGSWSLGFHSAYIDMAWIELLRPLNLLRYEPDVIVRHDNYRTGRRPQDELDDASFARIDVDRDKFQVWREREAPLIRAQLEALCVS